MRPTRAVRSAAAPVGALARLEIARSLRAPGTAFGAVIFSAAHGVGRWQGAGSDGLFVIAFLASWALAFAPALSADRGLSFDRLLVLNLLTPGEYALGKAAAAGAWTACFAAFCAAVSLVASAGDLRFAAWHGALALLLALAALPAVVATDLLLGVRLPAAVALVLALVGLVILLALGVEPTAVLATLGLLVTPYAWTSLAPLLWRACLGVVLAPLLVGLAAAARGWGARDRRPAPYRPPLPGSG